MDFAQRRGYAPSLREIGEAADLASMSSVSYQLPVLQRKEYLQRIPGRPRTIELRLPGSLPDFLHLEDGGELRLFGQDELGTSVFENALQDQLTRSAAEHTWSEQETERIILAAARVGINAENGREYGHRRPRPGSDQVQVRADAELCGPPAPPSRNRPDRRAPDVPPAPRPWHLAFDHANHPAARFWLHVTGTIADGLIHRTE
jgi:hypothetical protein